MSTWKRFSNNASLAELEHLADCLLHEVEEYFGARAQLYLSVLSGRSVTRTRAAAHAHRVEIIESIWKAAEAAAEINASMRVALRGAEADYLTPLLAREVDPVALLREAVLEDASRMLASLRELMLFEAGIDIVEWDSARGSKGSPKVMSRETSGRVLRRALRGQRALAGARPTLLRGLVAAELRRALHCTWKHIALLEAHHGDRLTVGYDWEVAAKRLRSLHHQQTKSPKA